MCIGFPGRWRGEGSRVNVALSELVVQNRIRVEQVVDEQGDRPVAERDPTAQLRIFRRGQSVRVGVVLRRIRILQRRGPVVATRVLIVEAHEGRLACHRETVLAPNATVHGGLSPGLRLIDAWPEIASPSFAEGGLDLQVEALRNRLAQIVGELQAAATTDVDVLLDVRPANVVHAGRDPEVVAERVLRTHFEVLCRIGVVRERWNRSENPQDR